MHPRGLSFDDDCISFIRNAVGDANRLMPLKKSLPRRFSLLSSVSRGLLLTSSLPRAVPPSRHPAGERLQVLGDGGEVELIARAGEAAQPEAIEAVMGFQMGKAHLDLAPLMA
jgi:hypothetical protein